MSPQLLWALAGIVLTVLTMGGVTISSYNSLDASTGKLLAAEAGNIATSTKLWMASKSANGTFESISAESVSNFIPDLAVSGTGAASTMASKVNPAVTFAIASDSPYRVVTISVAGLSASQGDAMHAALLGKACLSTHTAGAATLTYACNG